MLDKKNNELNLIIGKNYKCIMDLPAINVDHYNRFTALILKVQNAGIMAYECDFNHSINISCCFIQWVFDGLSTICRFGVCDMETYRKLKYDVIDRNHLLNCKRINMLQEEISSTEEETEEEVDTSMDDVKLGQTVWFLAHDKYHNSTVSAIIKSLEYDTKYEVTYLNVKIQLKRNDLWLVEPTPVVSIKAPLEVAGLDNAIALAAKYFEGEYDKSGQPYILHCIQVMENVRKWGDVELEIAAVLHDIIEDTEVTAFDLLAMGYSQRVVNIVTLVSFEKGCDYDARILEICNNQDAIKVKMADLEHNSMILRMKGISRKDLDRTEKYHRAYFILAAHLEK